MGNRLLSLSRLLCLILSWLMPICTTIPFKFITCMWTLSLDFTHPNEQLGTNKSFQLCMFKDRTVIFESYTHFFSFSKLEIFKWLNYKSQSHFLSLYTNQNAWYCTVYLSYYILEIPNFSYPECSNIVSFIRLAVIVSWLLTPCIY